MPIKFKSDADRERYTEGRLSPDEKMRALAWDQKERDLQAALKDDLIEGFTMEALDLEADAIDFSVTYKPQLDRI